MRRICCLCGLLFGLKEPLADDSETHGYCEICESWIKNNIEIELKEIEESPNHLSQSPETYNLCFGSPSGIGHGVGGDD